MPEPSLKLQKIAGSFIDIQLEPYPWVRYYPGTLQPSSLQALLLGRPRVLPYQVFFPGEIVEELLVHLPDPVFFNRG